MESQPVELDSLATPLHGKALLLREILEQLDIEQFRSLLFAIGEVRNIVLFAPIDARWSQAGFTPGHVLDAETYIQVANQHDYRLARFLKLPYKGAYLQHQLDARVTLLQFQRP